MPIRYEGQAVDERPYVRVGRLHEHVKTDLAHDGVGEFQRAERTGYGANGSVPPSTQRA